MILLGVTGSLAAYKAVEILRRLQKAGQEVHVILTENAVRFVGSVTFQAISGHPALTDPFDPRAYQMTHLHVAEHASAVLIAPASADSLSRLARGGAGDLISASVLAVPRTASGKPKIPVLIAPAMHEAMWLHPATQENVKLLRRYGYQLIGPERGPLGRAGDSGEGRLSDPALIVKAVLNAIA